MKYRNKRFLITGAAGFIGSHLAKQFARLGASVIAVDNFSCGKRENLNEVRCEIIETDVCDRNLSNKIKGEIDFILHFGSPSSIILFNQDPLRRFSETSLGFLNIIELAKTKGVEKVVFPSSGSVYGRTKPPQSEESKPCPVNLYGVAKLTCEAIAELYRDDVKSVSLRIFAGYGPGEYHKKDIASPITIFLTDMLNGKKPLIFGNGTQSRDFVYIDDIVKVILKTIELETPPVLNVGSGKSYMFNEVIRLANELLGLDISPRYLGKPVNYLERTEADLTLLKRTLSFEPLSLQDGLKSYLNQIRLENKT
jgi:UDP-glucose 4-epimerase